VYPYQITFPQSVIQPDHLEIPARPSPSSSKSLAPSSVFRWKLFPGLSTQLEQDEGREAVVAGFPHWNKEETGLIAVFDVQVLPDSLIVCSSNPWTKAPSICHSPIPSMKHHLVSVWTTAMLCALLGRANAGLMGEQCARTLDRVHIPGHVQSPFLNCQTAEEDHKQWTVSYSIE
jgi:hypothetical protein